MPKCDFCNNEADHTLLQFYHDYGCVMAIKHVCTEHIKFHKPSYGSGIRGCYTIFNHIQPKENYHIRMYTCDYCRTEYTSIEQDSFVCKACEAKGLK